LVRVGLELLPRFLSGLQVLVPIRNLAGAKQRLLMGSSGGGDHPGTDFASVGEPGPICAEIPDLMGIFGGIGDGMSRIGGRLLKC
jgi:hypothetical protein